MDIRLSQATIAELQRLEANFAARGQTLLRNRLRATIYAAQRVDALAETYEYVFEETEVILWNITEAKHCVAQHAPELSVLPLQGIAKYAAQNPDLDPARVVLADPTVPGIAAPLAYPL